MRGFTMAAVAVGLMAAVAFAGDDKKDAAVREVPLKDVKLDGGKGGEPTKITSADELTKAVEDKDAQEAIAKQVDFKKEYLLLFRWTGSGQDKLTAATETKEARAAVFTLAPGRTKDLRQHTKLFAVAKDTTWSMAGK